MQINSVLSGMNERVKLPWADAPAAAAAAKTPTATADPLAEVMRDYDLTRITPERFSEMLYELRRAGALTDAEYAELAQVRADLDRQGVGPQEPIDLVELYQEHVAELRQQRARLGADELAAADDRQIAQAARRLEWIEKLALVHAAPESVGLDLTA